MVHKIKKLSGFYITIYNADGTEKKKHFASDKELMNMIEFDGQTFWLDSESLGEVSDELQWNWKKLTPKFIAGEKKMYIEYLKERS